MRCDLLLPSVLWSFHSFNPHTYMRCDLVTQQPNRHRYVSIHTPTWGVTHRGNRKRRQTNVSIHTPTWGVTCPNSEMNQCFTVSIHTPTWGVTISSFVWLLYHMFQSTHLHEVWHLNFIVMEKQVLFQSTHLHEVWLTVSGWNSCLVCFNPHTYMRCDLSEVWHNISNSTFQSTHLHEVWLLLWTARSS